MVTRAWALCIGPRQGADDLDLDSTVCECTELAPTHPCAPRPSSVDPDLRCIEQRH